MIDTITISKELQEKGLGIEQADAIAQAIGNREGRLATKEDLKSFKEDVKEEIKGLKTLMFWLVGMSITLNVVALGGLFAILLRS